MKTEKQKRHEAVITILNSFVQFENMNLKKFNKCILSRDVHKKFSKLQVNSIAVAVSDIMNLSGASVGDINLYTLLQAYLLDKDMRHEINNVIGIKTVKKV